MCCADVVIYNGSSVFISTTDFVLSSGRNGKKKRGLGKRGGERWKGSFEELVKRTASAPAACSGAQGCKAILYELPP